MDGRESALQRLIRACVSTKLVVGLLVALAVGWGVIVAPFDWDVPGLARDPVPVDAIPDTGDNQQIVFTEWPGRSPQDVEDQVTYPLTVGLLGLPSVKTIRSNSMFGFSAINVIFEDDVEFYWSRSRVLEKLASLPAGLLPEGVQPTLGPDATPLGQVFWYTLEGRDDHGAPAGGWELHELRSLQDFFVRYSLAAVDGVAEVASIGGFVQEYQIDVDPDALRAHRITLEEVFGAVRASNLDVGARTIEINRAEYAVRGLGFVEDVADLEQTVVAVRDGVPIQIGQVARVALGPAQRRGVLDKGGAEAVGGVVVARYGANPLQVIQSVKDKIASIRAGLPQKTLDDGTVSRVTVVPFYDRSGLIEETLHTLNDALLQEILVTIIVVLVMVAHLRSAALISALLPLAVLMSFIAMKQLGVDANVVALSGIAIAIGTLVDVGIIVTENILRHIAPGDTPRERFEAVIRGAGEVGGAVLTAVSTTVISFLPVFAMEGPEGKLFKPLAFTKTFALCASIVIALVAIPPAAHLLLRARRRAAAAAGPRPGRTLAGRLGNAGLAVAVTVVLGLTWEPLGPDRAIANLLTTGVLIGGLLAVFDTFHRGYEPILRWCLRHKLLFLTLPAGLVLLGATAWLGFEGIFGRVPDAPRAERGWRHALADAFPGLGKEFMPALDEGSFLLMPITMAHASIGEATELLQQQDMLIRSIPEVESVVGKIGRVESALDPAPVAMVETVITYKPEYLRDEDGELVRFAWDDERQDWAHDERGALIPDAGGRAFRNWRDHIESPDDIWTAIADAAAIPGMTRASMLQPIENRRIMLQTGMRSELGIKVYGPDLATIERVGLALERLLRRVPGVRDGTVVADRIVGKPYLEIDIDRSAIARHGLSVRRVQEVIEVAVGGKRLTTTVQGRERYPVRVRYPTELRGSIEDLERILVAGADGAQVPLGQLATIRYAPGPQSIKSEDTFLVGYVLFGKDPEAAEVDVVEGCRRVLEHAREEGELVLPDGVHYEFAGAYQDQLRAEAKLRIVLPLALLLIFLLLYLQFRSVLSTLIVFSGVFVAWAGGFILVWLYGQEWFLAVDLFGVDLRELFQVDTVHLSVAVWVGFLALFGIATDDGVLMSTYLRQSFAANAPRDVAGVREAVVEAGKRRIRPCLMTSATTVLALLPVLTSTGRGSDVMVPMAIPSFGGMVVVLLSVFVVPVLNCWVAEWRVRRGLGA